MKKMPIIQNKRIVGIFVYEISLQQIQLQLESLDRVCHGLLSNKLVD
jgi:hypothetical protein